MENFTKVIVCILEVIAGVTLITQIATHDFIEIRSCVYSVMHFDSNDGL
jgi:hypothetical protein